jgi:formate dehydrogenase major subunit
MALLCELDTGTPIRVGAPSVTLTIDGQSVSTPAGTSVMAAAASMGTQIPRLCATDMLAAFGSCRLCLVEIEGRKGTPASCTTPVEAGMVVKTQTPRLAKLRRGVMELYISDHPLDCLTCSATCAMAIPAPITSRIPPIPPIPISLSSPQSASYARAACAPARRSRARSR